MGEKTGIYYGPCKALLKEDFGMRCISVKLIP
jgi:hypothetical protein